MCFFLKTVQTDNIKHRNKAPSAHFCVECPLQASTLEREHISVADTSQFESVFLAYWQDDLGQFFEPRWGLHEVMWIKVTLENYKAPGLWPIWLMAILNLHSSLPTKEKRWTSQLLKVNEYPTRGRSFQRLVENCCLPKLINSTPYHPYQRFAVWPWKSLKKKFLENWCESNQLLACWSSRWPVWAFQIKNLQDSFEWTFRENWEW